jgi:hypothetical protein
MAIQSAAATQTAACTTTRAQRVTKSLLGYGPLAGIVFEGSVLIQGPRVHDRAAHRPRETDPGR